MNIFILDNNAINNAKYHVDKHVVKMRLELAQLACTAYNITTGKSPYKTTHSNHPSNVWVRESLSNYLYTVNLGLTLCNELRFRFNTKEQKVEKVLLWLQENKPNIKDIGLTTFPLVMPDEYKTNNVVSSYRSYYNNSKQSLFKWTNRQVPFFINN